MRTFLLTMVLVALFGPAAISQDAAVDLAKIERRVAREPRYQNTPHYAMLVFGPKAEHRSWLVIDGDSMAYVDRNGNGDLTEPDERIELDQKATNEIRLGGLGAYRAMHVFKLGKIAGAELTFNLWVRNPDFDASKDAFYRDHFREMDENKWVNGSLYRTAADGSAAQNPLLLTVTPADAQISHMNGPLTFDLKWHERQVLEPWPKEFIFDVHIGTRNLLPKNCKLSGLGFSPLTTSEVPADVQPIARFEIPTSTGDGKPIVKTVRLDERCCGDTFYARMTIPQEASAGRVRVTVSCPFWVGQLVAPAEFEVPINAEIARYGERSYVMFSNANISIKHAVNSLRRRGLDVNIKDDQLVINQSGEPAFGIELKRGEAVRETTTRLAHGTNYAAELSGCDARFEVSLVDATKIEEQSNTIAEIRSALQEITRGVAYNTWDKAFIGRP